MHSRYTCEGLIAGGLSETHILRCKLNTLNYFLYEAFKKIDSYLRLEMSSQSESLIDSANVEVVDAETELPAVSDADLYDVEGADSLLQEAVFTDSDRERFPATMPEPLIKSLQAQTLLEFQAVDAAIVEKGMSLFFCNQFKQAEDLFSLHYREDCLVASAYATLGTIRALLSMEQVDVDEACKRLVFASSFALQISPPERMMTKTIAVVTNSVSAVAGSVSSVFSKASGMIGARLPWGRGVTEGASPATVASPSVASPTPNNTKGPRLTASQFRAQVVHAEAEVLRATLLLLQDSFKAYLRAGLALRRSYNTYAKLEHYLRVLSGSNEVSLDSSSVEGVHFGLGCIHVVTSILPPKILAVLKALGYMHNRDVGFDHLQHCLQSNTLRSSLASLFVLAFHGVLPSFAVVMKPTSIPVCMATLASSRERYPVSMIHLWLAGRVKRLTRDVNESNCILKECMLLGDSVRESLPQLRLFALYDAAWNMCLLLDWSQAADAFAELEATSNWSKKAFSYAAGCCFETLAVACYLYAVDKRDAARALTEPNFFASDCGPDEARNMAAAWMKKATVAFLRSHEYASTRLGGKVISIDQFVTRRLSTMLARRVKGESDADREFMKSSVPVSGVELARVFNMLSDAPPHVLEGLTLVLKEVGSLMCDRDVVVSRSAVGELLGRPAVSDPLALKGDVSTFFHNAYDGESCVTLLLLADCVKGGASLPDADRLTQAEALYTALLDPKVTNSITRNEEMKWVAPFAFYERALCRYCRKSGQEGSQAADKVLSEEVKAMRSQFGRTDYHFEMQMQFRLHLTEDFLRHQ